MGLSANWFDPRPPPTLDGGADAPIRQRSAMASTTSDTDLPAIGQLPSERQKVFARYLIGTLIDLVVLNLFAEYWDKVYVDTFTTSLLAAILLQLLLKATIWAEHLVAAPFKGKPGAMNKFLRYFMAWLVLFGSKFVILEALALAFGENVHFVGWMHGIIPLIVVVVVMRVAEELVVRFYRKLA